MKWNRTLGILLAAALLCSASGCSNSPAASSAAASASSSPAQSTASSQSAASGKASAFTPADKGISAPVGSSLKADLNGDGAEDTIYYAADSDNEEHPIQSLSINGTEFKDLVNNENSEVYLYFPDSSNYYVTDLDTSDTYKELAVQDLGPSDDPTTWFFRYDGTNLTCMGYVPDLLSSDSFQIDGQGTIRANQRLSLLQTWAATFTWKVADDKLQPVPEALYSPNYYPGCESTVTLTQPLKVYSTMDTTSPAETWQPNDTAVTFPATDNEKWVEVRRGDDVGWVHFTDFCIVENDGETDATVLFSGLFLAD
jgi:hypothetical protein